MWVTGEVHLTNFLVTFQHAGVRLEPKDARASGSQVSGQLLLQGGLAMGLLGAVSEIETVA